MNRNKFSTCTCVQLQALSIHCFFVTEKTGEVSVVMLENSGIYFLSVMFFSFLVNAFTTAGHAGRELR